MYISGEQVVHDIKTTVSNIKSSRIQTDHVKFFIKVIQVRLYKRGTTCFQLVFDRERKMYLLRVKDLHF